MAAVDGYLYPPRGMSREEAARYVGVDLLHLERMMADDRMPRPKLIDGRSIWDRFALDAAFSALPSDEAPKLSDAQPPAHLPNAYSPTSLAKRWFCSERHVRNLCATGQLPSFKLGGTLLRIRREDVERVEQIGNQPARAAASDLIPAASGAEATPRQRARRLDSPVSRAHKPQK
jgi:hypothetical protein